MYINSSMVFIRRTFFSVFVIFCFGIFHPAKGQAQTIINNLRCEYLTNPIAIENPKPLLGWWLQSAESNKRQTAYQILVASSFSLLEKGVADFWDSGKINSSCSQQIAYKGKPLASRQTLYWKVRIWDEQGKVSQWSETEQWTMGLLKSSDWLAKWIGNQNDCFPDSAFTYPAPYFRKTFQLDKQPKEARIYISGLGFYELTLNGKKVGDQVLAPALTNYDRRSLNNLLYFHDDQSTQRVFYNTFDITSTLQQGTNTMGVILGNGWYNQRDRTVEGKMWYDTPRLLCQLEITYTDGTTETIVSDETWKTTTGPLLHDGIFSGEIYDARLELHNWNLTNYDDSHWKPALLVRAPTGCLRSQLAPHEKIIRTLPPTHYKQLNDSTYRYAFPEMISGWVELCVKGNSGNTVRLRFIGEEKGNDFGQTDYYILRGGDIEKWEPRFTWHAFRYVEATSPQVKLDQHSLVAKVIHTNPTQTGYFNCSNELFNRINEAYLRTQTANFHGSVSTDCPHRERLAYTGDGQVVVESSLYSFDMTQFYRKWFDDINDARNKKSGYVPHTAPFGGGGGGPAWGSAYLIMPWAYYCFYGDTTILSQHYEGMKQWVHYLSTRTDERGIVVREEPDGWCLGDWCTPGNRKIELPESLVNTAYYYHCASLLSKIETVLGKTKERQETERLCEEIRHNFNTVFFNPATHHYWEGRQGADIFPLAFGIVPESEKEAVLQALLSSLKKTNYHFDTGILATPLLLKVLSENGYTDIAFRLMNQRDVPGFGYVMDDRYSCLWERWEGKASRCHPMFGSVVTWFYQTLAGIRFNAPLQGQPQLQIAPQPVGDLTYCNGSYQSLYGLIRSEWRIDKGIFKLTVEIPPNVTATIRLPDGTEYTNVGSGIHQYECPICQRWKISEQTFSIAN